MDFWEGNAGREATERRLAELRSELGRVQGTQTEVYSRIVGYYRSVRNWNAGKRDEYGQRVAYAMPGGLGAAGSAPLGEGAVVEARVAEARAAEACGKAAFTMAPIAAPNPAPSLAPAPPRLAVYSEGIAGPGAGRDAVLVFTREACPNCSPVANYVMGAGIPAVFVDVDREEGLELARSYGIMATPTVLVLDGEGRESYRGFGVNELRARFGDARPC